MRHPALAQQQHLDALTLLGGYFPSQRCFQPPDLALGAFDHLFPSESDDLSESHLASRRQFTATFGTRYPKHFDSISYGSGMRAEFLKIFSRISSQRFSFGLSSGEYGGRKSSETLPGSARSLQRWLGAPSRTKRISCLATFRDRAVRKT